MKIIKHGAQKDWWVGKQLTCSCCLAVLELEKGDFVKEYKNSSLSAPQIYVECPECKQEIRLYFQPEP